MLEIKTTFNGRQPPNEKGPLDIESWISQQPLIGSSPNLKPKLREQKSNMLEIKTTFNRRRSENSKI